MARTRSSQPDTSSSSVEPAPTRRATRASIAAAAPVVEESEHEHEEDAEEDAEGVEAEMDEDMEEDMMDADEDLEEDMADEDGLEYADDEDAEEDEAEEEPVVAQPAVKSGKKSLADLLASADSLPAKKPVVESDSDSDSDSDVEEESVSSLKAAAAAHEESLRLAAQRMKDQKKATLRRKQEEAQEHARKKVEHDHGDELLSLDVLEEAEKDHNALHEEKMRKKNMGFIGKEQMMSKSKVMRLADEAPPKKRARVANVNKPKVFQKDGFTVAVNPFSRDRRLQMIDIAQDHVDNVLLDRREQLLGTARRVPSTSMLIRTNKPAAIFSKQQRR